MTDPGWMDANWPAPDWLNAGTSLRYGGVSDPPYDSLNLGLHVNDNEQHVIENRRRLAARLNLPSEPTWLRQVHGNRIVDLEQGSHDLTADGAMTGSPGMVCAIMTADCVPVLFCDTQRRTVAAVHAGWRGISRGIISKAAELFPSADNIMVWVGPHIQPRHYEVDQPVYDGCIAQCPQFSTAFMPARSGHWLADLGEMITIALKNAGITRIYHNDDCTFANDRDFFSHRRDGITGRMATLVWISP